MIYEGLKDILPSERLSFNEPMSRHTTFKIGGPADVYCTVTSEELSHVIRYCRKNDISYYIVGNGSNLLVSDKGYRGVIVRLCEDKEAVRFLDEERVYITAGCRLATAARAVAQASLKGFEFAAGIPGTLGGAVVMNAGAYGGEIKDCIVGADVLDEEGEAHRLTKDELELGYRTSIISKKNYTVLGAEFRFEKGIKQDILNIIEQMNNQRKEKQPLELPSAGSTFKRPEGNFAGKLIMEAGLRGFAVGDAAVSEKHCGFVVNKGNATAADVCALIEEVKRRVEAFSGIVLEPEIKFLGEF